MKALLLALVILTAESQPVEAQIVRPEAAGQSTRAGWWSIGLHGGANMWINDFDTKSISGAGGLSVRYGLTRQLSLGFLAGFEVLQSTNSNTGQSGTSAPPPGYLADKGISADLVGWYHFNADLDFSPYLYLGVGAYMYTRNTGNGRYYPDDKQNLSIHIPAGLGIEIAVSKQAVISLDLGARILDDYTDYSIGSGEGGTGLTHTDWYPAVRVGVNYYFGGSDDSDNDRDGLTNSEEKMFRVNPNNPDTDGDGLSDGEEIKTHKTDPRRPDSDGDGLKDGEEIRTHKTSPAMADTDGDGLSDGSEVLQHNTNPAKPDTDGDGIVDGQEILHYKTNHLKPDTDGDGLTDGQEVNQYKTDPLKADTDGGSVYDGQEAANKTNPLLPGDDVPTLATGKFDVGRAIVLEGIVFPPGKAIIEPESEQTLIEAFITLKTNPRMSVEIRGYTDNTGKASANQLLSQQRAEAVRDWLIQNGIEPNRITARGLGQEYSIGDNRTAGGRAKNQRIEIFRTR
jgi:outer membrane protein OmpA-like peptidoglycan-associated protein/outer membrane protein W